MTRRPHIAVVLLVIAAAALADGASEVAAPTFVLQWGGAGAGPGQFHSPIGIAIDQADVIYVSEFHNRRVQKFDTSGKYLGEFPVCRFPGGIAVDKFGRVYVASLDSHQVHIYDTAGVPLDVWGVVGGGAGPGQFKDPGGIAIGPDGSVYVADQSNHRVQRFTPAGKLIGMWGGFGPAPGQFGGGNPKTKGTRFAGPHFIAFDGAGDLLTTEGAAGRIQKLTVDGKPLLAFGDNGREPGGFGGRETAKRNKFPGPIGIAVDHLGRVWVGATNSRVQVFAPDGSYLTGFLTEGDQPGQFDLPHAIAVDSRGDIYVVDASNQRVQKFSW